MLKLDKLKNEGRMMSDKLICSYNVPETIVRLYKGETTIVCPKTGKEQNVGACIPCDRSLWRAVTQMKSRLRLTVCIHCKKEILSERREHLKTEHGIECKPSQIRKHFVRPKKRSKKRKARKRTSN